MEHLDKTYPAYKVGITNNLVHTKPNNCRLQKVIILRLAGLMSDVCNESSLLFSQLEDHSHSALSEAHKDYWTENTDSVLNDGLNGHPFSRADVMRAIGVLDTNGHHIYDWDGGGRCGYRGIFPVVSLLTHNCVRNTKLQFRRRPPYEVTAR